VREHKPPRSTERASDDVTTLQAAEQRRRAENVHRQQLASQQAEFDRLAAEQARAREEEIAGLLRQVCLNLNSILRSLLKHAAHRHTRAGTE